jgi:hypothetical protein
LFYLASEESNVHESKEFAGVTILFKTSTSLKPFASVDTHGKTGIHGVRRKSDSQRTQFNMQDKYEYEDKTDHTSMPFLSQNFQ